MNPIRQLMARTRSKVPARFATRPEPVEGLRSQPLVKNDGPVVLHLGSQKTGTTAVQRWCRRNRRRLAGQGIGVLADQPAIRVALEGWYDVADPGKDDLLRVLLTGRLTEHRAGLFYSCESNIGPMFEPADPRLYPRFSKNIAGVERGTAGLDRLVQFTIRHQVDFIESAYVQKLRQGSDLSFDEFLAGIDPDISWVPLVTEMVQTFGADRVIIYDYDRHRDGELPLVGRLLADALDHLGLTGIAENEPWDEHPNRRYTQRMADLSAAVLPYLQEKSERVAFATFVQSLPPAGDRPATFFRPTEAQRLNDRYRADLDSLRQLVTVR